MHRVDIMTSGNRALLLSKGVWRGHATWLPGAHTQRILGETQTDSSFHTVGQFVAVQVVERFACHGHLIKFHKTHGSVLLVSETQSLVPTLLGKQCLKFLLRGVWGKVTHVKGIAWRIQIIGVGGGQTMA